MPNIQQHKRKAKLIAEDNGHDLTRFTSLKLPHQIKAVAHCTKCGQVVTVGVHPDFMTEMEVCGQ